MGLNQLLHAPFTPAPNPRAERDSYADNPTALAVRIRTLREDGSADVGGAPIVVGERVTGGA